MHNDNQQAENEIKDENIKNDIIKSLFSKFIAINPIENIDLKNFCKEEIKVNEQDLYNKAKDLQKLQEQSPKKKKKSINNLEGANTSIRKLNENILNMESELQTIKRTSLNQEQSQEILLNKENQNQSININLKDVLDKLLKGDYQNINFTQFEFLGEFSFIKTTENKSFFDIMIYKKIKNQNKENKAKSLNPDDIDANKDLNKNKQMYFLVYYRITNGVIDVILHDNTLIKNTELAALEHETKKKVLSKIAHEFKTPINTIIGQISLIKEKYKDYINAGKINKAEDLNNRYNQKDLFKNLDIINYLSNYTIYLIRDLMQFLSNEKVENIQVDFHKVNLKNIIQFSFEIMKTLLHLNSNKEKRVETLIKYDNIIDHMEVLSDETRLNQILLNLISNAVKFTNNGFIKISCLYNSDINEIEISVEDSGSGIKDEDKDLVFDNYSANSRQINLQYQNNKMGSGYGLKISYDISKKLKHSLSFNSQYQKGSSFNLKIIPNKISIDKVKYISIKEYFKNKNKSEIIPRRIYSNKIPTFTQVNEENLIKDIRSINYNENNINKLHENSQIKNDNKNIILIEEKSSTENENIFDKEINKELIRSLFYEIKFEKFNNSIGYCCNDISNENSFCSINNEFDIKDKKKSFFSPFRQIAKRPSSLKLLEDKDIKDFKDIKDIKDANNLLECKEEKIFNFEKELTKEKEKEIPDKIILDIEDNKKYIDYDLNKEINFIARSAKRQNKILIIDDNDTLRQSMVFIVEKYFNKINYIHKLNIIEGKDGKDLVRYVLEDIFKNEILFIITDENMEMVNGSQAVKFLRDIERGKSLIKNKIILASSEENNDYKLKGFDYSINKPIRISELDLVMKEILS